MKLGFFDSGLGGLVIARAVRDVLPDIDMVYLGDTLRLPYGNRSTAAIYEFTKRAMIKLFDEGCALIVIACNTASAAALRRLQQEWLPAAYPDRNIIGVVVPTLEDAVERGYTSLGLIGTNYIISSNIFRDELKKLAPDITLTQRATPLLVPLVENDGLAWADGILRHYLAPLQDAGMECLILGCTHYPFLKPYLADILGADFSLLSQDDSIPLKLKSYLSRHAEYNDKIARSGQSTFLVTDLTDNYINTARQIYSEDINVQVCKI